MANVVRYFKFTVPKEECQQSDPCSQVSDITVKKVSSLDIFPPENSKYYGRGYPIHFIDGKSSPNTKLMIIHEYSQVYKDGNKETRTSGGTIFTTNKDGSFRLISLSFGIISFPFTIGYIFVPCTYTDEQNTSEPVTTLSDAVKITHPIFCNTKDVLYISDNAEPSTWGGIY